MKQDTSRLLEQYLTGPNGQHIPRCQALKKNGEQCGASARKGFRVCSQHGAGTRKREEEGSRKPAGRPPTTPLGIYKREQKDLLESLDEGVSLGEMRRDLDRELVLVRATLATFLRLEPATLAVIEMIEKAQRMGMADADTARALGKQLLDLQRYHERVQAMVLNVASVVKAMAEIDNKSAQTKALEQIGVLTLELKLILTDFLTREQYDSLFEQVKRRVIDVEKLQDLN
jgi:hypothetical protein